MRWFWIMTLFRSKYVLFGTKKNPSRSLSKPSRYDINVQDCIEQSFPTSSKCLNPNWRSRRHHIWKRGYKSETKLKKFKTVGCGCSVDFCISRKTRTWHSFWTSVETLLKRWVEGALRAPSTHRFKAGSNDRFWHMTSKIDRNAG